jgi:PST family polysaccharide transporter
VVAIAAAFAGWGVWSVVASALAFSFTNVLILYLRVGWLPTLTFDWRAVHAGAVESLMYQSQQGASLAKFAMLPLLGGLTAGGAGVGYVTWAHQIAVIPIQLTHLISRVSFPALSRLQHDLHAFTGTLRAILKWTCVVTFPACALLIGLGPQLVDYVYGPKWEPALLAFYLFTANTAINAPVGVLMPALYSLGRSTQAFRALLIMLAVTWAVGIALTVLGVGLEAAAFAFLAGMIANLFVVARDLADVGGWALFRPLALPLASAILGASLLYVLAPATIHDVVSLVVVAALAGLFMLAINLWGEYGALLAQMKALVARTTQPSTQSTTEERQDAGIGTP